MSITSPLDLAPLVWVNPTSGTYSGSNLTALTNAGTVGGSFTVTGTIAKSTAVGSFTTLRMDNVSKRLNLTHAIASGVMTVVYWGKLTASGGLNGIMGRDWPSAGDAKAFYANTGAGETIAFAKGCCSVDPAHAPALDATAGGINDTSFHTMFWQMGATNALFKDNVSQTITTNATGAMPSTGSVSWNYGSTDVTSEPANADIAGILVFDFALTSTQRNDLDTWIQGQASGSASLALAATEAQDVVAISVGLTSFVALAATEAKDTAAIAVGLTSFAALAATEAKDTASIAVGLTSFATLAATEALDVAAFNVTLSVSAALAATEAPDTAIFTVTVPAAVTATQLGGSGGKYHGRNWPDTPKRRRVLEEVSTALDEDPAYDGKELAARVRRKLPGVTAKQVRDALAVARVEMEDDEAASVLLAA